MWDHNSFESTAFIGNYLKVFLAVLWCLQLMWACALIKMCVSQWLQGEFKETCSGDYEQTTELGVERSKSHEKPTIELLKNGLPVSKRGSTNSDRSGTSTPTTADGIGASSVDGSEEEDTERVRRRR
jgi:hypothetical protein